MEKQIIERLMCIVIKCGTPEQVAELESSRGQASGKLDHALLLEMCRSICRMTDLQQSWLFGLFYLTVDQIEWRRERNTNKVRFSL